MDERLMLVSADGHAGPPVAEYRPYVESSLRDEFDDFVVAREEWRRERNRTTGLADDDELVHALFGPEMVDIYLGQEAVRTGGCSGVWDSERRNLELEGEGIVAEVLFPDFQNSNEPPWGAAFPYPDTDARLRLAGARIFNRWLADFCSRLPGRRAGVAIVQPHDIDVAVAEMRWAKDAGLASVMLPTGDSELPSYHDRYYDPLWAAAVDLDIPVTYHSGGVPWMGYGSHAMWVTKFELMWWGRRPLHQLVFGGVFERFPDLRVAFTELGADWIPSMLERLDEQYQSPFERGITDILTKSPTEYWHSNCYVGASFMSRAECEIRDGLGVDRMMWGADYPHIEGTWPYSLVALKDAVNGCTAEEVRMIVGETAAAVYHFDVGLLRPIADRVGPRVDEVVSPRTPPPATYPEVDYALGKVSGKETGRRLMSTMLGGGS